jgi:hypothetical protein
MMQRSLHYAGTSSGISEPVRRLPPPLAFGREDYPPEKPANTFSLRQKTGGSPLLFRRNPWLVVASVIAGFIPASAVKSQATFSVDLGASHISYTDSGQTNAASIAPFSYAYGPAGSLSATGTYSHFNTGGWSLQGSANGSAYTSATAPIRGEFLGNLSATTSNVSTQTGSASARARLHAIFGESGFWIGGGAGQSSDGEASHTIFLGDFGLWHQVSQTVFELTLAPTHLNSASGTTDPVSYTDAEGTISWSGERADFFGSVGARFISSTTQQWASASGTVHLNSWLGLAGSMGNYAPDYTQGIPGGRYVSVALRITAPRKSTANETLSSGSRSEPESAESAPAVPVATNVEIFPVAGNERRIRIHAVNADTVEITGDFSDWDSVPLTRAADGWWETSLSLPPGIHRMNVRLNGGHWIVPEGLTSIADDFGGEVGLLVVH